MDEWINGLLQEERLYEVVSPFPSAHKRRTLLVSPDIWKLVEGPWLSSVANTRCTQLRADLDAFAVGMEITICPTPFEAKEADFGFLRSKSNSVWDYRSRHSPGIRLFGQFARKDTFVALIPASRSRRVDYLPRGPLNDKDSSEWKQAIRDCECTFRSLFAPFQAVAGGNVRDVISYKFNIEGA